MSAEEEAALLAAIDGAGAGGGDGDGGWRALSKRRVQHYGYAFDYVARGVDAAAPLGALPPWLRPVLDRIAPALAPLLSPSSASSGGGGGGEKEEEDEQEQEGLFDQVTVNEYAPGVGLAPHVDTHSAFGAVIASLSLAGSAVVELRRPPRDGDDGGGDGGDGDDDEDGGSDGGGEQRRGGALFLPRRSLLVMSGEARYAW